MDARGLYSMLLPLMASGLVTLGQNHSLTKDLLPPMTKTTLENQTQPIMSLVSTSTTKPESIPSTPHIKVSGHKSIRANESQAVEEMTGNSSGPVQRSSHTNDYATPVQNQSADIQTAATQNIAFSSQSNTTTEGTESKTSVLVNATSSATMVLINQTHNSTTQATNVPPLLSTTSDRQGKRSTSITTNDKNLTSPSLRSTPPTNFISTYKLSTKLPENNSTNTGRVTGGGATTLTSSNKTSTATKTSSIAATEKRLPLNPDKPSNGANHGKAVAWIIGGALVLMMVGFLIIFVKKQKIQKQQITTNDWAGPSPFLEGGAGRNGQVELRTSNRISLSSFLPMRMSRRLSMLQETDEEIEDIHKSTFGDKQARADVQANNGTAVVIPEDKGMGDAQKTGETSVTTSQTNDLMSKNDHTTSTTSDVGNNTKDNSANTPTLSEAADRNPPPHLDNGLSQL